LGAKIEALKRKGVLWIYFTLKLKRKSSDLLQTGDERKVRFNYSYIKIKSIVFF
jgi:hypothetical protein